VKSLAEIEAAIALLSADAQRQLIEDIPALCPTVFPGSGWNDILADQTRRPDLASLMDQLDAEYAQSPERFIAVDEDSLGDKK